VRPSNTAAFQAVTKIFSARQMAIVRLTAHGAADGRDDVDHVEDDALDGEATDDGECGPPPESSTRRSAVRSIFVTEVSGERIGRRKKWWVRQGSNLGPAD
jgi:hypothetical protein